MIIISPLRTLQLAAILGCTAVLFGAFAAHGLKDSIEPRMLEVFKTGVLYHMFHALALLAIVPFVWHKSDLRSLQLAIIGFLLGTLLFSGSLYLIAITGIRWVGTITPVGGVCFLLAWVALFMSASSVLSKN